MYKYKLITIYTLFLSCFAIPNIAFGDNSLRDPTQPFTHKNTQTTAAIGGNIKISAIFAGKHHNSVIINKHIFVVGDKIANSTIIAIDKNGITLKNEDGSKLRIEMSSPTIKSPTKNEKKNRENSD